MRRLRACVHAGAAWLHGGRSIALALAALLPHITPCHPDSLTALHPPNLSLALTGAEGRAAAASPLAESDKATVRAAMLEGVTRAPHAVRVQLGECCRSLVYSDYPQHWPQLLEQVQQYLVSQASALRCAVRSFRVVARAGAWGSIFGIIWSRLHLMQRHSCLADCLTRVAAASANFTATRANAPPPLLTPPPPPPAGPGAHQRRTVRAALPGPQVRVQGWW